MLGGFVLLAGRGQEEEACSRWERRFAGAGCWVCRKLRLKSRWVRGREVGRLLAALLLGSLLSFCLEVAQETEGKTEKLERGETEYEEILEARVGEESYRVPVQVQARIYEAEEVEEFLRQAQEELKTAVLNGNASLKQVRESLYLPQQLPGNPVQITWMSQEPGVLDDTGKIENHSSEPIVVKLQAQLSCQGESRLVSWEATVLPQEPLGVGEELRQQIEQAQEGSTEETVTLPERYGEQKVEWSYAEDQGGAVIFGLSALAGIALLTSGYQERRKEKESRERQMLLDYPEIVNRLLLLLGAGLNTRKAFRRLASDYQKRRQAGGGRRYAYEELAFCCRELDRGVSEQEAYEGLGLRCSLAAYKNLSTLLVQNLKKGNKYLLDQLEQEAAQAFDSRKRQARILGEEAGTRLLFPMILLLGVVFVIILAPAWMAFGL